MANKIIIRPFQPDDQDAAEALILRGMEEHWGFIDPTLNPDLKNIAASYITGIFLVAVIDQTMVGTGAILPEDETTGQVVRMSVLREFRRSGVATRIMTALCAEGRKRQYRRLVLGTNADWDAAIAFYQQFGFRLVGTEQGGRQFALNL